MDPEETTLVCAIQKFVGQIEASRSKNTAKTYKNGMNAFLEMISEQKNLEPSDLDKILIRQFDETCVNGFSQYLKLYSPTTETLYINVLKNFLEFLAAENILNLNLNRVKMLIKRRTRKPGIRLPQFPEEDIRAVLDYAAALSSKLCETDSERLINFRDSAFLITLADTGLRIHEICALRLGDINWKTKKAVIIGKGNKEAIIRFSDRSIMAMRSYLTLRSEIGEKYNFSRTALPLFARHDKGAGGKTLPISTKTGRMIVSERVVECLGEEAVGTITPHSFRHFFVTTVLQATGNLKIAQEFARHTNIAVTQRYSHLANEELDDTYDAIFGRDAKRL